MNHLALAMPQLLWLLFTLSPVIVSYLAPPLAAATASPVGSPPAPAQAPWSLPGCPGMCGNISIPYPFGISAECSWPGEGDFIVHCNESVSPPKAYVGNNVEIKNISVESGDMHVFTAVAYSCYNSTTTIESYGTTGWEVYAPFQISPTKNVFTAIGCNTLAYLEGTGESRYFTGCISYCEDVNAAKDGEPCTGIGCCQTTSIPARLTKLNVNWGNNSAGDFNIPAWEYNQCSYAFVAAKGWYNFRQADLEVMAGTESFNSRFGESTVLFVLDWAISKNGSCQVGPDGKSRAPACVGDHSECVSARGGDGYLCNCSKGYQGNPYLPDGCIDIDECDLRNRNPKVYAEMYHCGSGSTCKNIPGGFECKCNKFWHKGDGRSDKGCQPRIPVPAIAAVATGAAIFFLGLLLWFVHKEHKQRLRRGFFDKNGGKLLQGVQINVYTEEQLKKITNQYSNSVGKGNFGKVFMGTIEDNQRVAVKRAIRDDDGNKPPEGGDFVHEILFQFQMRHKNLVRLVGCCLETKVPMLVFEFVSSGSLFDVLHGTCKQRTLSLLERIDIAIGSAEALVYMHSHGHQKRIHGDIKSANILLDDDLSPKVSDFGSSKVVSSNSRYVTFVASDINYVDPVYMKTYRFTEKSDVYSFGVVLLELITGKAAKYDGNNSLPIDFAKCCKVGGNRRKMYDQDILADDDAKSCVYMECLDRIGALALCCLNEDVDERPAMAEVLEELKRVKAIASGSETHSEEG